MERVVDCGVGDFVGMRSRELVDPSFRCLEVWFKFVQYRCQVKQKEKILSSLNSKVKTALNL